MTRVSILRKCFSDSSLNVNRIPDYQKKKFRFGSFWRMSTCLLLIHIGHRIFGPIRWFIQHQTRILILEQWPRNQQCTRKLIHIWQVLFYFAASGPGMTVGESIAFYLRVLVFLCLNVTRACWNSLIKNFCRCRYQFRIEWIYE